MPVRLAAAALTGAATIAAAASLPSSSPSRRRRRRRDQQTEDDGNSIDTTESKVDGMDVTSASSAAAAEEAEGQSVGTEGLPGQEGENCVDSAIPGTSSVDDSCVSSSADHQKSREEGVVSSSCASEQSLHKVQSTMSSSPAPAAAPESSLCLHDKVFQPPPAEWFDEIDNNDNNFNKSGNASPRSNSGTDEAPKNDAESPSHAHAKSNSDEGATQETTDSFPLLVNDDDECAAYDSSFGCDDSDSDDNAEGQVESGSTSSNLNASGERIGDSIDDGDDTSDIDDNDAIVKSATIAPALSGPTMAAVRALQYTGKSMALTATFHVTKTLPRAAGELVTSSIHRAVHSARLVYSNRTWVGQYRQHSDLSSGVGGYYREDVAWDIGKALLLSAGSAAEIDGTSNKEEMKEPESSSPVANVATAGIADARRQHLRTDPQISLPPFSSLPWVDRQLVKEWRTYDLSNLIDASGSGVLDNSGGDTSETEHIDNCGQDNFAAQLSEERLLDDGYKSSTNDLDNDDDNDYEDYVSARTLVPKPLHRPPRENAKSCHYCLQQFGPTRHRHHCRLCGRSCCNTHSSERHRLPHLGYDPIVAERVCFRCKSILEERNLAERIAWRLARVRDYLAGDMVPYFVTGVDSFEDVAVRITRAAISMARRIPLGAQATVAVETLEVLRKHGLKGVYGLILRKEFMAAADLLCQACGINSKIWPMSVHELSAAIFYALAHHRAVRGMDPESEQRIHTIGGDSEEAILHDEETLLENEGTSSDPLPTWADIAGVVPGSDIDLLPTVHEEKGEITTAGGPPGVCQVTANSYLDSQSLEKEELFDDLLSGETRPHRRIRPVVPVCKTASDPLIASLLFYAPLALNFIYATSEVDMQLLAAQQGWRLLYAHLDQSGTCHATKSRTSSTPESTSPIIEGGDKGKNLVADRPAFALLARHDQKLACMTIRGTATINDVVTDIRAIPVPFPPEDEAGGRSQHPNRTSDTENVDTDWTSVSNIDGLALCGMARAAINLYRENIDVLAALANQGYRIRIVGHSLGGGVAALLGALVRRHLFESIPHHRIIKDNDNSLLRVYAYGTPACADAGLADECASYVTSCVLHDDVVPRLSATSIRGLLKHLLFIRETWVKDHLSADISAYAERAKGAWAPRWRQSFTLIKSKSKSHIRKAKKVYKEYKDVVTGQNLNSDDIDLRDNMFDNVEESGEVRIGPSRSASPDDQKVAPDLDANADANTSLVEIDGDLFYEAEEDLLESDPDQAENIEKNDECVGLIPDALPSKDPVSQNATPGDDSSLDDAGHGVLLEETPLPRMYIPGKIVHIYTHRGAYKATEVPRQFRELRRISLAGNMLSDHLARQYYEALLEVKSVRRADSSLPEWTGFGEESTCACCASRFTWASTSDTKAQEARDKHNCRMCGGLVCDPCSRNRLPLPEIGINLPSRVCDRCYNDMGRVDRKSEDPLSRSFHNDEGGISTNDVHHNDAMGSRIGQDQTNSTGIASSSNSRQRRSVVVDELASKIQSLDNNTSS